MHQIMSNQSKDLAIHLWKQKIPGITGLNKQSINDATPVSQNWKIFTKERSPYQNFLMKRNSKLIAFPSMTNTQEQKK